MASLQSLLGAMAASSGGHEDLSEAEAEMKLALEEACQEAGVTLSPAMSPKNLCVFDYRENMPGVGKVAGWLRTTRRLRKVPAFQRRCKSAEELTLMQAISEEQEVQIVGQAAGGKHQLQSRLQRGNSEPETGRADLNVDLGDAETDESLYQSGPLSPLSPANILERLGSARTLDINSGKVDWSGLAAVYRTEHADDPSDSTGSDGVMEIKINSGGVVYFAAFQYAKPLLEQGASESAASGSPSQFDFPPTHAQHVPQMAVTTSQEGAAVEVRAFGSQGMTQLSFPLAPDTQGANAEPPNPMESDPAAIPQDLRHPLVHPFEAGVSVQSAPERVAGAQSMETNTAGLKVRVASRTPIGKADARTADPGGVGPHANGYSKGGPQGWGRTSLGSASVRHPRVEMEEFAACMKFAPSRLATQSERLGSELARHLGVATPEARVIHSGSEEWAAIHAAVEKAKERASDKIQALAGAGKSQTPAYKAAEDEERTCEELLDALRIFRCLLLMGYVHGKSLKDSPGAVEGSVEQEATARSLGRVLVLDLVLRNEDRLAVKRLGWQENAGNLRYTERPFLVSRTVAQEAAEKETAADLARVKSKTEGAPKGRFRAGRKPRVAAILEVEGFEAEGRGVTDVAMHKRSASAPNVREIQEASMPVPQPPPQPVARGTVVVIDSGIPRRPPKGKMEADRKNFPKLMELLLCDVDVAAEILHEVSSGKLLTPSESAEGGEMPSGGAYQDSSRTTTNSLDPASSSLPPDQTAASEVPSSSGTPEQLAERRLVEAFQRGVREAVDAVHTLRPLLSRLHQRLDGMLRALIVRIGEVGKADLRLSPSSARRLSAGGALPSPSAKKPPSPRDAKKPPSPKDATKPPSPKGATKPPSPKGATKPPSPRDGRRPASPRDTKLPTPPGAVRTTNRTGSGSPGGDWREPDSPLRGSPLRFTIRLKDWQKVAKVDDEVSDMLEEWDAKLRQEATAICEAHGFVTGFLEWAGGHSLVDSYELKVRLEHVLERIGLILAGAEAQRPSQILPFLFVGGVASARSCHVLQHLGITHVVNMAPDDTLGEDGRLGEFPDCFKYMHCQARDTQVEDIGRFFEPVSELINAAATSGGKVLVHCFEGKSRSVAVVVAYLMLHKDRNLAQAWAEVKAVHPRAAPNDGFAQALVRLDKRLHGPVGSMEWKGKKPIARLCPFCGKNAGISTDSLRVHLRKMHPEKTAPLPRPAL